MSTLIVLLLSLLWIADTIYVARSRRAPRFVRIPAAALLGGAFGFAAPHLLDLLRTAAPISNMIAAPWVGAGWLIPVGCALLFALGFAMLAARSHEALVPAGPHAAAGRARH